eukprot:6721467-Pyramimonas_sp.AAC.1
MCATLANGQVNLARCACQWPRAGLWPGGCVAGGSAMAASGHLRWSCRTGRLQRGSLCDTQSGA